jgi:hypothetical protein
VRIAVAIGVLVVVDVVPCPPQRALLHRRRRDDRPEQPRAAVHLERPVRVVAVKGQRQADARKKCDTAQSATNPHVNGTTKTSRAETWTSQKITIESVAITRCVLLAAAAAPPHVHVREDR